MKMEPRSSNYSTDVSQDDHDQDAHDYEDDTYMGGHAMEVDDDLQPWNKDPKNASQGFWKHPRLRGHWKTVAAALTLLVLGFAFLIIAITLEFVPHDGPRAFVFAIIGVLVLIPGAYQSWFIYNVLKGTRGYTFSQIPSFD
eukprot:Colp12_sorted_trinity150504_noHs@13278